MAVQRNSEAYQGPLKDTRQVAQTSIAASKVTPDVVQQVGDSSWRSNLVNTLVGLTTKMADKSVDVQTTEAYLNGAVQAGAGASESELENDTMTRDWEVAGFRDTMGKLAVNQAKAKEAEDMRWLQELPPAKMAEYLATRRKELLPQLNGMSLNARQTMLPQVALADQASMQAHKAAHAAHIVNVTMQTESANLSTAIQTLDAARQSRDVGAYEAAVQSTASAIWGIHNNKRLPAEAREKLTSEFVELALSGKHVSVYNYLRDNKMPGELNDSGLPVDSTPMTILNRLPLATQEKLGSAYQKAWEATAAIADTAFVDRGSIERAALESGQGQWTWDQTLAYLDDGMIKMPKVFTPEFRSSFIQAHLKSEQKKMAGTGAATAYLNNNVGWLKENGLDVSDGLEAAKRHFKGLPAPEQFARYVQAGELGTPGAYKAAGEVVNGAVASLSDPDGKISVENAALLSQVHSRLDAAATKGDPIGAVQLLEGLTPANAKRLERYRALHAEGIQGQVALDKILQAEKSDMTLTPQEKAVVSSRNAQADMQYVAGIGERGWLGTIGLRLHALLGTEAGQQSGTEATLEGKGVGQKFVESLPFTKSAQPFLHGHYLKMNKEALIEELHGIDLVGDNLNSEGRVRMAAAKVAARLVEVPNSGIVVLPKGQTPTSYFGVPNGVPNEVVQQAIGTILKPSVDGGKFLVTPMHGRMAYVEVDRNGIPVPNQPKRELDPKSIGGIVERMQNEKLGTVDAAVGAGVTYSSGDIKFAYNGKNTAGARETDMLKFRQNLIKNEGVRNTPYSDTLGNEAVGVAVTKGKNPHYPKVGPDGKVSNKDIADSFYKASSDAASVGLRLQAQAGLRNSASFQLFSEAAYHGLGGFAPVVQAVRTRDTAGALTALQNSKAYKLAGPDRKKHYESLLTESLKG